MGEESDVIEGFPFMGSAEHETPRNMVCRECIVSPSDLALFATQRWSDVCHGAKDLLKEAAVRAMKPVDDSKEKGPMCVLLYGAPGTGKTFRVRALGSEFVDHKIDVSSPRVTVLNFQCNTLIQTNFADSAHEIVCVSRLSVCSSVVVTLLCMACVG